MEILDECEMIDIQLPHYFLPIKFGTKRTICRVFAIFAVKTEKVYFLSESTFENRLIICYFLCSGK